MARPLRIEYEGAVYHIISKGNRGEGKKKTESGLHITQIIPAGLQIK
jgi:hypothetical protein